MSYWGWASVGSLSNGKKVLRRERAASWGDLPSPESEGGASREEHRLGFRLGLLEEAEEGVIFDTDLPEDFTTVPAGHQKLQSVLIRALVQQRLLGLLDYTTICCMIGLNANTNQRHNLHLNLAWAWWGNASSWSSVYELSTSWRR